MSRLYCRYLFLISPSIGALRRMCFVIVAFPGYLHVYVLLSTFLDPFSIFPTDLHYRDFPLKVYIAEIK